MRITLDLDEALIARAGKLTGIQETETLVRSRRHTASNIRKRSPSSRYTA